MDYERIEKPSFPTQGGGFSPKRLRAMLLGVERRRKDAGAGDDGGEQEQDEEEYGAVPMASVRSDDDARRGGSMCEEYKDVDVVSTMSGSSSSLDTGSGHRSRDSHSMGSRFRVPEEDSCDSESVASNFEFHKERGASARSAPTAVVAPFSKPPPSKWDDAQKWIASPTTNRPGRAGGAFPRKMEKTGFGGGRLPVTKVVLEAMEEIDTKRIDPSQEKREIGWQKAANWATPEPYPEVEPCAKSAPGAEITLSCDSSTTLQSATACIPPPPTVRSVSMRDMGTEMTPIASQEPSRTGTPVRATSPDCSRPTTPRRTLGINAVGAAINRGECSNADLSEEELQMKTRREIMLLGTQLGKTSIAAWASKKEEEKDASLSLKTVSSDQSAQNATEVRAAAWEEAEKAKYLARFKREEIKIHAWEDHQKAKIEAEMRKIEVEVERMRARAQDKLMSKLASTRHTADEQRAAAESKRDRSAARTAEQAEHIRRTGRMPSSLGCWNWCS
ncbi:unnamed protein product [Triticum turgidum subsp. durum]|uniref:Remorin C-terminal domain-containing protein n=1 Tax=Triticum turgidum subsp. durum TaxID=4567 RepID=A0A9R1AVS9_TRITD|nr:unnamed protein product [Triticum turgidum subsp. durum]